MSDEDLIHRYHAAPDKPAVADWDRWTDSTGRSTYQILVDEIRDLPRDLPMLDLACGEGYLLDLLAQTGFTELRGVDLSEVELGRATARLGPHATLDRGDARALPYSDDSFGAVVCHMALMLMNPIDPVLAEVARVLRPGGSFVALTNRYLLDPAFEIYRRALHRVTFELGLERAQLGDSRVFSIDGLETLLAAQAFAPASMSVRKLEVGACGTPDELWALLRWNYDVFRLPEHGRARVFAATSEGLQPLLDDQGRVRMALGMHVSRCEAG